MTTKALVGPMHVVTFGHDLVNDKWIERGSVNYRPPRDTLDPRYNLCVNHHVACDCREATMAEDRQEWRYARQEQQEAFDRILAGHPTWDWDANGDGRGCQCTGCQLARAIHVYPKETA